MVSVAGYCDKGGGGSEGVVDSPVPAECEDMVEQ